jgi:hypothetical protein
MVGDIDSTKRVEEVRKQNKTKQNKPNQTKPKRVKTGRRNKTREKTKMFFS